MHLLSQRKTAEAERFQLAAQLSLLEPTAARLRSGERIPSQELDRITKLVRSHRAGTSEREEGSGEEISWREVMLGRKKDAREAVEEARRKRAEEWDRRDLEAGEHARTCSLYGLVLTQANFRGFQFKRKYDRLAHRIEEGCALHTLAVFALDFVDVDKEHFAESQSR
ncbi:hypothetical protein EVJ58_g5816 [Rhodofomes roseus]|uniref:Uncharacterized protein n=1 Tax=Rhodofomes roseus TaxID=34475 RepID=A0A4Y9YBW1_9APHY|nr:hypothetical protein EVJ58_g5816 [Rhodofomes roseus]